jgi:ElaB/YqjD/DUF883 family membrane-anchored ribosome-binding protein
MALQIGSENADSGMSQAIYQEVNKLLSPPLQKAVDDAEGDAKEKAQEALDEARKGWRKLSYAIAKGVVEHITTNMEVYGIQTSGNVTTTVDGDTGTAPPGNHDHSVDLTGEVSDVVFTQSNDGAGHIR